MTRPRILTIILAACLVLALVYLVSDISLLTRKKADLTSQIQASSGTLDLLPAPAGDVEIRLSSAAAQYEASAAAVSGEVVPTEVIKILLELCEQSGFRVNPITTEQWSLRNIGQSTYRLMAVRLSLEGRMNDILEFLAVLENENLYPWIEIEETHFAPLAEGSSGPEAFNTSLQIKVSIIERVSDPLIEVTP